LPIIKAQFRQGLLDPEKGGIAGMACGRTVVPARRNWDNSGGSFRQGQLRFHRLGDEMMRPRFEQRPWMRMRLIPERIGRDEGEDDEESRYGADCDRIAPDEGAARPQYS